MKFLHTADLHLFQNLKHVSYAKSDLVETRQYEIRQTFYNLLKKAQDEGCDALFIVGDLFDHHRVKPLEVEQIFKRLKKSNLEIFIILGNHDQFLFQEAYKHSLNAENIHLFNENKRSFNLNDTTIHGFNTDDFDLEALKKQSRLLDEDKQHILLLHGDVMNSKDDHYLTDVQTLTSLNFDYIALGHIHKHQFLSDHIAYSGNPEPSDFSELENKGVIVGQLENHALNTEFKATAKRAFIRKDVPITETDSFDDVVAKIQAAFSEDTKARDFIRVRLTGEKNLEIDIDKEALITVLKDDFYYLEIKDETTDALDLNALKSSYKDTIIESLITTYETKKKPSSDDLSALKEALIALLATEVRR